MDRSVQLGPFHIGDQIGEGGMGAVYRGTHRETEVPVAIKVIDRQTTEEIRRQFHREVQAHAGLLHPGIVYLFEYGVIDRAAAEAVTRLQQGNPYVAMELADRGTVWDAMPVEDWETVCRLVVQVLDALAYSHARGVIHRDLKSENLLVFDAHGETDLDWRVKLADFGIAHAFGEEREASTDQLEAVAGTPLYMAPEQTRGEWRQFGPWTDLYALGCIVWHLVCGRPPFTGDNALAIALKHETADRPKLEPKFPVPEQLASWVRRAMATDPEDRFQRAADALWALPRGVFAKRQASSSPQPQTLIDRQTAPLQIDSTTLLDGKTFPDQAPTLQSQDTDQEPLEIEETIPQQPEVETATVNESDLADSPDAPTDLDGEALQAFPPPLPEKWRSEEIEPLPAPLVGAGLGLFGLREPPFVDRHDECDRIWAALHEVVDEQNYEMVFVRGTAGTGKTRLAEWMTTRAHELGAADIVRAVHTSTGGRHEGLRGAFDRCLRTAKLGRGEVFDHLRDELPRLDGETPDDTRDHDLRALTEYLRPTDRDEDEVEGPNYRFSNARQRRGLIVRTLRRLAAHRPVILWLDDLQWGPEAIGVLEYLVESPKPSPQMLILATVRSDVVAERPQLRQRLDDLQERSFSDTFTVSPLPNEYQRELLTGLLPLENGLATRLAERTEGHPLFAMQLLGHWIEEGDVTVAEGGFRVPEEREQEISTDIHQLWMERLGRLVDDYPDNHGATVVHALELAAALGREIDTSEWEAVLEDADLVAPSDLVDRLVERGLAQRTAEGWSFAHGLLVDSLAKRARQAGHWKQAHRQCARSLAARQSGDERGANERVAAHWIEADEPARALAPLFDEIKRAGERSEDDNVRRLLARRKELLDELQVPDDDPRRIEQQIESARLTAHRDNLERAKELLTDLWATIDADPPALRTKVAHLFSQIAGDAGDRDEARRWAKRAIEDGRRSGSDDLEGRAHRMLAWDYFFSADLDRAETHAHKAWELSKQTDDHYGTLQAIHLRACIRVVREEPGAGELFERVRREAEEAGYVEVEARALNGLGNFTRYAGDLDRARDYYNRYFQKMRELSRPKAQSIAELNLAEVELRAGNFDRVLDHLHSAEASFEVLGAEKNREGRLHLIRLTYATGIGNESTFQTLYARLQDGWPDEWRLNKDDPWLLETAGAYAREAGWTAAARDLWQLARDLWERLNDHDAAAEVDDQLADL